MRTEREIRGMIEWLTPITIGKVKEAIKQTDPFIRGAIFTLKWVLEEDEN